MSEAMAVKHLSLRREDPRIRTYNAKGRIYYWESRRERAVKKKRSKVMTKKNVHVVF